MALTDVILGHQTYTDYVSSQEQIKGFEKALIRNKDSYEIGLNQNDYKNALVSGLGSISESINNASFNISNTIDNASYNISTSIEIGLDKISSGIDNLNADFNFFMGDLIWKIELQNEILTSILKVLQKPLDTEAKELRIRAEDAYRNGWYEEALTDLIAAKNKNYQDFTVHRTIANIYLYHIIDLNKSLEHYLNAAKYALPRDKRQSAEAYFFAGLVCSLKNNYKDSVKNLKLATDLNSQFYDAYYRYSSISAILGNEQETLTALAVAIKGDPRYYERSLNDPTFSKLDSAVTNYLQKLKEEKSKIALEKFDKAENMIREYESWSPNQSKVVANTAKDYRPKLDLAKRYMVKNQYMSFLNALHSLDVTMDKVQSLIKKRIAEAKSSINNNLGRWIKSFNNESSEPLDTLVNEAISKKKEAKKLMQDESSNSYKQALILSEEYRLIINKAQEELRRIEREKEDAKKEQERKIARQKRRKKASKKGAMIGAIIGGVIGFISYFVIVSDKELFDGLHFSIVWNTSILIGALIGYLRGKNVD